MENQSDKDFINKIDCDFPYHDKKACLHLISEAATLSINAIYFVIEQICRIPSSNKGKVNKDFLLELLAETKNKFYHPLKEMILDTASRMILGHKLTVEEAISRMESIKDYKDQFAALSIVYFSCDDINDRLDMVWNGITLNWINTDT